MTATLRLLIIADVGGVERRHIGDEAMLEANLDAFRRLIPKVAFTVVSQDPAWTAARYGVDAVAPFGFSNNPSAAAERDSMLDRLLANAVRQRAESSFGDSTFGAIDAAGDAIARADGLVLSGGGNLSSTWPDLLYERVALLQLAHIFGKPAVVLGQTLGPNLKDDERRLLAKGLSSARFVGLRELPSAALALTLGVPPERIWYQCDDALTLKTKDEYVTQPSSGTRPLRIAVTIDPQLRATGANLFSSIVRQLRELSETTGASLILVPHEFGGESRTLPSDLTEARLLATDLGLPQTVLAAGLDADEVRQITGEAALVISSRYHPIVFGLAAGVPCLGLHGDDYCRIKLQGALAHAQLQRWTLTYDEVRQGQLLRSALELWQVREDMRRQIESRRAAWCEEARRRWCAVLYAINPGSIIPPAPPSTVFGRPVREVVQALAATREIRHQWSQSEQESFARLAAHCREVRQHPSSFHRESQL
jgi:polysaccharide pyruvyl transferase WcaK-like protein